MAEESAYGSPKLGKPHHRHENGDVTRFMISTLKTFLVRYEHQLSIAAFVGGFIFDFIVLKRIDLLTSNIFLYSYLVLAGASIVLIHLFEGRISRGFFRERVHPWLPFVAQFAFGAIFSIFLLFYSQSGSLIRSWPFFCLLLLLVLGNEFFRSRHLRLSFQALMFFFSLFSFFIFSVPIYLKKMGPDVFLMSGAV